MLSGNAKNGRTLARVNRYPMLSLFDEVNRFFEDTVPAAYGTRGAVAFTPAIDVTETSKEYVLRGEFPGLDAAEIKLELRDNAITLSGEKRNEVERAEGTRHYVERSFGSFSRTIQFDVEVDEDNATAAMKNGILTVTVPKAAKEIRGTKTLSIKTS